MARQVREVERRARRYYTDGTAARQLNMEPARRYEPAREPEREPLRQPKKAPDKKVLKRAKRAREFDLNTMLVMGIATIMICTVCVSMLYLRTSYTEKMNNITSLQTELSDLRDANDAYEIRMESSVTLDDVYDQAIKLGMAYPTKSQTVTYESANDDYVRQYQDVPSLN